MEGESIMKKFAMFGAFVFAAAMALFGGAFSAEAKIALKFVNKTDRTIYVALATEGTTMTFSEGWYKVDPRKSWTYKTNSSAMWTNYAYYFAYAKKKGEKTWYWGGNFEAMIHPTKKFDYPDNAPDGMVSVGFLPIRNWKRSNNDEDATATVSLTE
jgi:uncharacterized membrane protein